MNVARSRMSGSLGVPSVGSANGRRTRRVAHGSPVVLGVETTTIEETVRQVVPYVKAALREDADEDVETLRARIANHRRIRDALPRLSVTWTLYDNKIRVLEAKLRAARKRKGEEAEDRASKWEWASLGKGSVLVGLAVGGALVGLLLNASGVQRAKRKFLRARTRALRRA